MRTGNAYCWGLVFLTFAAGCSRDEDTHYILHCRGSMRDLTAGFLAPAAQNELLFAIESKSNSIMRIDLRDGAETPACAGHRSCTAVIGGRDIRIDTNDPGDSETIWLNRPPTRYRQTISTDTGHGTIIKMGSAGRCRKVDPGDLPSLLAEIRRHTFFVDG